MSESDRKPRYQTRLPQEEAERVDEYADRRNLSHAAAVRQLIISGLEAEERYTRDDIRRDLQDIQTDGGELLTQLQRMNAEQRRRERYKAIWDLGASLGIVVIGAAALGYIGGTVTIAVGTALIAILGYAMLKLGQETTDLSLPTETEATDTQTTDDTDTGENR